ncbi:MAG: acyl-CoA dehydrogenase family protein [Martelella sp.]|uniref:acyl-CoA dehydrogenase family protein n=1 Tax=Martelella sp. TaxID=1969699 RepID=UPI003242F75D
MIDVETREAMEMIRDSAGGVASREEFSRIRKLRYTNPGFERAVWREMCEMGWPAMRVAEADGGLGLGMLHYCALVEEMGRGLVPEPLVSAVLATSFLKGDALANQLSGERLALPAWQDSRGSLAPDAPLSRDGGNVSAEKLYVPFAAGADDFVVIGSDAAALVAADAPGVTVTSHETQDGGNMASVVIRSAPAKPVDADPAAPLAEASLAASAYLLGVAESALDMTVAYLKTRTQFGKAIGSFQILQHMAVDLKLEGVLLRACIEDAAARWDREGPTRAARAAVLRTRVRAVRASGKITRDAIQLHGGIGFTDEHDIGLFLRKAIVVASHYGSAEARQAGYAKLQSVSEEA